VKEPQGKACLACHAGVRRAEVEGGSLHAPYLAGACAFCHDPHGNGRPKLLRDEPALLCLSCHTALRARIARATRLHDPVRAGACLDCHRQHAAPGPKLLAAPPPGLCGACHDLGGAQVAAAHPRLALAEARCVSCHDPHVRGERP
jgi:predicted CXXCH cytochrome family protein